MFVFSKAWVLEYLFNVRCVCVCGVELRVGCVCVMQECGGVCVAFHYAWLFR